MARELELTPDDVAQRARIVALSAEAIGGWLNPWSGDSEELRKKALAEVGSLRGYISELLADPRNAWWFASAVEQPQVWLGENQEDVAVDLSKPARGCAWEDYAQRPEHAFFTASEVPSPFGASPLSSLHVQAYRRLGDWDPEFPLYQMRVKPSSPARIFEICQPNDWHDLVRQYGNVGQHREPRKLVAASGLRPGPAPDWRAVAEDWDAVHLTQFGYMTATYTPVRTNGLTTTLWSWMGERTLWLRATFEQQGWLRSITSWDDLRDVACGGPLS